MDPEKVSRLRSLGDPLADPLAAAECAQLRSNNVAPGDVMSQALGPVTEKLRHLVDEPVVDCDKALCAYRTFARFGNEISAALLLAALPQAYATTSSAILMRGGLKADPSLRLRRTAQFLVSVMMIDNGEWPNRARETPEQVWARDGRATTAVLRLRSLHAIIRWMVRNYPQPAAQSVHPPDLAEVAADKVEPINQFELLGMLLTFTIGVFEALEKFGIAWSRGDQEAYYGHWDLIGHYLGVVERPDLNRARGVLDEIRRVEWEPINKRVGAPVGIDVEWKSLSSGRMLTRALLEDLEGCMSTKCKGWPLSVMRQLNPPLVRDRLALGGGGALQTLIDSLPGRTVLLDQFTSIEIARPFNSRVLQARATAIARATLLNFVGQETQPLEMPGLENWGQGLPARPSFRA